MINCKSLTPPTLFWRIRVVRRGPKLPIINQFLKNLLSITLYVEEIYMFDCL
jgi:hypothetical protein